MAIISFWSNTKKETAQTLSMIAMACYMAVENNNKILMIDTNFNDKTIRNAFFTQKEDSTQRAIKQISGTKMDIGSGVEGLAKLVASGKTDGEVITNYTKVIFSGRLEALFSHQTEDESDVLRIKSTYKDIIRMASKQYDYVFVDLPKGLNDPLTNEILEISDVIIFNITQRLLDMEDYMTLRTESKIFGNNKVLPLIGRYDRYSTYNKKNMAKELGEKEIPAVSYNTLFFEAANNGQLGDFFLRFRKNLISKNDRNMAFIEEVENATKRLVYKVQEIQMMR